MTAQETTLGEAFNILIGGTPARNNPKYWDAEKGTQNIWLSIRDLSSNRSRVISSSKEHIADEGVLKSNVKLIPEGVALMSFKLTVGVTAVTGQPLFTNEAIAAFVPKEGIEVDPFYLAEVLPTLTYESDQAVKGITLNKEKLSRAKIVLPSIDEQRKLAKILGAVDKSISFTSASINITGDLRQALLHQLMNKGIKHSRFKKTELGDLPEEWDVVELDKIARRGSGHTPSKKNSSYYNGGIKWISLADTNKLDRGLIHDTKYKISDSGIKNSSAVLHTEGSVVLSRDAGVGKSAVLAEDMAVSQHFMVWTCGDLLQNWFLYYYLQYKKPEFERIAAGSTIKTIGLQYFQSMSIPLPAIEEQHEIFSTMQAIDQKIAVNIQLKNKQLKLKAGIVRELFAGKLVAI